MAKTQIADILVPVDWEQYFIERTAEEARFYGAGIIDMDPMWNEKASAGGKLVELPFWQDLSGAREIIDDTNPSTPAKIAASGDVARIHNDCKSWSATDLAQFISGSDPMAAIVSLVGKYWARVDEAMLLATLNGLLAEFDSISGDPNYLKIASESIAATTAATVLNGTTFIDAKQKLGDAKSLLTAIAMHSAVEADLLKQQLIDYVPDADGRNALPYFQGLRVIVDDSMTTRAGSTDGTVYTTWLFGTGAIARGFAPLTEPLRNGLGTKGVEFARVALNHDDVLVNRRRHIMHPRGVKWDEGSVAGHGGPTDAELALAANWTKVYESKNIRLVGILHNLNGQIP